MSLPFWRIGRAKAITHRSFRSCKLLLIECLIQKSNWILFARECVCLCVSCVSSWYEWNVIGKMWMYLGMRFVWVCVCPCLLKLLWENQSTNNHCILKLPRRDQIKIEFRPPPPALVVTLPAAIRLYLVCSRTLTEVGRWCASNEPTSDWTRVDSVTHWSFPGWYWSRTSAASLLVAPKWTHRLWRS